MTLAKGHSSKTESQVSDIRTIGPLVVKIQTKRSLECMSHVMRKTTMCFLNRSDTNRAVQALEAENFGFHVAKTKALISFAVTAKLICIFVFAYADCWFSHDVAQLCLHCFSCYVYCNPTHFHGYYIYKFCFHGYFAVIHFFLRL